MKSLVLLQSPSMRIILSVVDRAHCLYWEVAVIDCSFLIYISLYQTLFPSSKPTHPDHILRSLNDICQRAGQWHYEGQIQCDYLYWFFRYTIGWQQFWSVNSPLMWRSIVRLLQNHGEKHVIIIEFKQLIECRAMKSGIYWQFMMASFTGNISDLKIMMHKRGVLILSCMVFFQFSTQCTSDMQ